MTEATKGWRGCLKIDWQNYSSDDCVEAADKAGVNAQACLNFIQSVSVATEDNIEELYELGSRKAAEILEGNLAYRIHIVRAFVDRILYFLGGGDSLNDLPAKCCIGVFPYGYVDSKIGFYYCGKFGNWQIDVSQPDTVMEEIDFIAECQVSDLVTI